MSLLTPLYLLGLAAVSLPVVFHLVRRMPRGRQPFSSLMFLRASPPRLTRRSRLDNLLLLLLRAAALGLVVLAFTRPFLRAAALLDVDQPAGRKIAMVIDTSASMQRAGLWRQATAEARAVLDDLGPGDDAALFAFDSRVELRVGFGDVPPADPARKIARLKAALGELAPGWRASDLGAALVTAADAVNNAGRSGNRGDDAARLVVLISDCQSGSRLDALANVQWPDDVRLAVHTVTPADPTNAAVHLAAAGDQPRDRGREVRVRVSNDRDSLVQQFELGWADEQPSASDDDVIEVYVPPGESRIVRVPYPAGDAAPRRLVLAGDRDPFDNTLYLAPLRQQEVGVLYIGSDKPDDPDGLRYYLSRAFPETARRKVILDAKAPDAAWRPGPLPARDGPLARLIVVGQAVPARQAARLKQYVEGGGTLLYVLVDAAAGPAAATILGLDALAVEEADPADYAMLGDLDFAHPLLAPFADPRFSDFTKIHFWKHRRVQLGPAEGVVVPARFDDGSPALFERAEGKGRVLVLTSGWHPADSELARSSKFVPLLSEVLDRAGGGEAALPQYQVGDRVAIDGARDLAGVVSGPVAVGKPDGTQVELPAGATTFDQTDQPGVYRLLLGPSVRPFAVNLAPQESKTAPLDPDELGQRGVRLGESQTPAEVLRRRQMRDTELENRQKLWRWLIAAALGVLIVETALAGYLARRPATPEAAS